MDINDFKPLFDHVSDGVYVVDEHRKIIYFNPVAEIISGYKAEEVIGSFCYDNILNHIDEAGTQLCFHGCPLKHSIDHDVINQGDVYLHHKKGHRVKVSVKTIPLNKDLKYGIEIFNEASEMTSRRLIEEINIQKSLNQIDDLTKLLNRRYLNELITQSNGNQNTLNKAILFIDIDNFRHFNNLHGHKVGDELLVMVSNTIKHNIRSHDFAIRYGGEEIVVILNDINNQNALKVAEKLRMLVSESKIRREKDSLSVTVSIGVSFCKEGQDFNQVITEADMAMLKAKRSGKNKVISYDMI